MSKRAGIKELRQYRGMTQGDLAGMIGVSPQALQRWETGKRSCDGAYEIGRAHV